MEILRYVGIGAFVVFFFGFCVFIHEFGHLIVALWRGLHVESFSIGFGKELWGFTYKGVRYKVSLLPFGGYVELPQLETAEEWKDSKGNQLPAVKPIDRMLTAFAGPLFNILFGFALGSVIWMVGIEKPEPVSSVTVDSVEAESPEAKAGLTAGDEIFAINGETFTNGYEDVLQNIILTNGENVTLSVKRAGKSYEISYPLEESSDPRFEGLAAPRFKLATGTMISNVQEGSAAAKAGLKSRDKILAFNKQKITSYSQFVDKINNSEGKACNLEVLRGDDTLSIVITPDKVVSYKVGLELTISEEGTYTVKSVEDNLEWSPTIQQGDVLTKLNGKDFNYSEFYSSVKLGEGKSINLDFLREGAKKSLSLTPIVDNSSDAKKYKIGTAVSPSVKYIKMHPTPFQQLENVLSRTWRTVKALTAKGSKVKAKHMSGPVGIVRALGIKVSMGFLYGLELVVFISFSLAIMNLLPLPVLDGGHITFASLEIVMMRKLPIKLMRAIETTFVVLLLSFMAYVTFYDIARLSTSTEPIEQTVVKI